MLTTKGKTAIALNLFQNCNQSCLKLSQTSLRHYAQAALNTASDDANARPFEQMPRASALGILIKFLPGGKYYKKDFTAVLNEMKQDYGPFYYWPGMLGKPGRVVTHNPHDFETVFRNEGIWPRRFAAEVQSYHRTVHRADYFQGTVGLVTSQDEQWGSFRSIVNPVLMQPKTVKMYLQKMSQVNKEFLERIREIRDPTSLEMPDNFEEEINRLTLESISIVALDKQLGIIKQNRNDPRAKMLFDSLSDMFHYAFLAELEPPIWRYVPTKNFKKLIKALDGITDVVRFYVNESIQRLNAKGEQARAPNEQGVLEKLYKINPKIAEVMAIDMLVAGVDSTSSSLAGLLLCLAKNPDKQEILREEVMNLLPQKDSEFGENSLNNIPYLRACLKESIRMYPITVGNGRNLKNDVVLSGYQVPKDTSILMLATTLGNDDRHFPRAKEYLPERWLRPTQQSVGSGECPHALKTSTPFAYLPFGFGPRMCIGRRFAEMELELVIARLIRNFRVEFNYSTKNAFKSLMLNVPNIPLKFKFIDLEK